MCIKQAKPTYVSHSCYFESMCWQRIRSSMKSSRRSGKWDEQTVELFPPPLRNSFQDDVFAINYISIAFPMKQFSFKFILRVIV